jgi:hypothetical protein
MTNDQIVTRGFESSQVLDNPAFKNAMDNLKSEIIAEWKRCPIRDKEGQMLLLQMVKLADKFEGMLIGMVESGKLAQHKIDIDSARDESTIRRWVRRAA